MSASGPGDRIASTRDVAIYFREDCRTLRDSLQLEMVVAQYWPRIRDVVSTAGLPVGESVGTGVVAELEGMGDELSHAILLVLAKLSGGVTATRAAEAAARLGERETGLPPQFEDAGKASPRGAWRTQGGDDDEYAFFAEFEFPRGGRHTVMLFVVETFAGPFIKHIGLLGGMNEVDAAGPFDPEVMEVLEIAAAGELLRDLLEATYGPPEHESDDHRVIIAAARARSMVR